MFSDIDGYESGDILADDSADERPPKSKRQRRARWGADDGTESDFESDSDQAPGPEDSILLGTGGTAMRTDRSLS